jgi:type IV secretion system protein VirB10
MPLRAAARAAAIVLSLVATLPGIDPERDFSGKWVLDSPASNYQPSSSPHYRVLTVAQQEGLISCSATAESGQTVKWSYALNNEETRYKIGDETRNTLVKWEGAALLINTLVSGLRSYTEMDRWRLSRDRTVLTITRHVMHDARTLEETLRYNAEGRIATPQPPAATTVTLPRRPETPAAAELTIRAGTRIPLSLRNPVDTRHSRTGDRMYFDTVYPMTVDGVIVVPRGSSVTAVVIESPAAKGGKRRKDLSIRFELLTLPNGVSRDLRSRLVSADGSAIGKVDPKEGRVKPERDGARDRRTVAQGAGIGGAFGGIVGAAAGAAVGLGTVFGRGAEASLPRGTVVEIELDRDLHFSASELQP